MTIIPIYVRKGRNAGKQVGYYNTDDLTYHKEINYKSNQMMQHPKYRGQLYVSKDIIGRLINKGCINFKFLITGYEKENFFIMGKIKDFIDYGKEVNWDDPQLGVDMNKFQRFYPSMDRELLIKWEDIRVVKRG